MAIMDRLVGYKSLADLPEKDHLPMSVFESIGNRLRTLHDRSMVHGDIRDSNIMIHRDNRTKFMIIDFDWAGTLGTVIYPPHVNYTEIRRPEDARDGLLIKAAHDQWMLSDIQGDTGEDSGISK